MKNRVNKIRTKALVFVCSLLSVILTTSIQADTELYYIHNDHRGAPVAMTNQVQTVVWKASYTPFGETTVDEDPDGNGNNVELNVRLPGQYFDKEMGTYYNYYRDYDPALGKYIQADPIGITNDFSDPQMQVVIMMGGQISQYNDGGRLNHLYGYVNQAPLLYIDPYGLAPDWVKPAGWVAGGTGASILACGAGATPQGAAIGWGLIALGLGLNTWAELTDPVEMSENVINEANEAANTVNDAVDKLNQSIDRLDNP